jgi:hypothetical protein
MPDPAEAMKSFVRSHLGARGLFVENDLLRVCVLPEVGGKIASILYKPRDFEVLFQPAGGAYEPPVYGAPFSRFDTSGADEMFPTIDPCEYPVEPFRGKTIPDHGELWSLPWEMRFSRGGLTGQVRGVALPYLFERELKIRGGRIYLRYRITNAGTEPFHGFWAFHGLCACGEESRIILPGVRRVVNVHESRVLGASGALHDFPVTKDLEGKPYDLGRIGPAAAGKAEKFYAEGRLRRGSAALTLDAGRLLYSLTFPPGPVPHLAVWINEGGFKGEYNCALEPACGFRDSLADAVRAGGAPLLLPGRSREHWLRIDISPARPARRGGSGSPVRSTRSAGAARPGRTRP